MPAIEGVRHKHTTVGKLVPSYWQDYSPVAMCQYCYVREKDFLARMERTISARYVELCLASPRYTSSP